MFKKQPDYFAEEEFGKAQKLLCETEGQGLT